MPRSLDATRLRRSSSSSARAFLITPFSPESAGDEDPAVFRAVQEAVDLAATRTNLDLVHPARMSRAGVIMEHVEEEIQRAEIVIAILTGKNPNVFFELGQASCPKILIVNSVDHIPFDLRHHRTLTYSGPDELAGLAEKLAVSIEETVAQGRAHFDAAERDYLERVSLAFDSVRFAGFERSDLFTGGVPLTSIFVPLALDELKLVRQPSPKKDSSKPTPKEDFQPAARTIVEPVEIGEALHDNIVILGDPGSGKSALLRWIAIESARKPEDQRIPFFIELAQLPEECLNTRAEPSWPTLLPGIVTSQQAFAGVPQQMLAQALTSRSCLLLFDGLDEVANPKTRRRLTASLAEFTRLFPNHRVVLTTRPGAFAESESVLRTRFRICRTRQFAAPDLERCFQRWYALDAGASPEQQANGAHSLLQAIEARPRLLEIASSPLLATILLLIWRNEGELPEHRPELYERCCRMLIRWESQRDTPEAPVIDPERMLQILAALAHAIHSKGQLTASRSDMKAVTGDAAEASLLESGSGILQRASDDLYRFPHQTVQEYLTARHIASLPDAQCLSEVTEHLHEEWWNEVHRLVIAQLASDEKARAKASRLVARILDRHRPPNYLLRFHPHLAPRWTLGRYLPGVQLERRIAWTLRREFELAATGWIESGRDESDARLVAEASSLLLELARDPARAWVSTTSPDGKNFSDVAVSSLAANALRLIRTSVPPTLIAGLKRVFEGNDFDECLFASVALGELAKTDEGARSALVDAIADAPSLARIFAARACARVEFVPPALVPALLAATRDPDASLREAAAASLGWCHEGSSEVIEALSSLLAEESLDLPATAALSLTRLGHAPESVIGVLLKTYKYSSTSSSWDARQLLVRLARTNDAVLVALVTELDDYFGAPIAATLLGSIGRTTGAVVPALIRSLQHKNKEVHKAAAASLGKLGIPSDEVVQALTEALEDSDSEAVAAAAEALGRFQQGSDHVVSALAGVLLRPDLSYILMRHASGPLQAKKKVAVALGKLANANPRAERALLEAVERKEEQARTNTIEQLVGPALNELERNILTSMLPSTRQLQEDPTQSIRLAGLVGLGHLARPHNNVIPALLRALQSFNLFERQAAARSLGQLGCNTKPVIEALRAAVDDHDDAVWQTAVNSLKHLGAADDTLVKRVVQKFNEQSGFDKQSAVVCLGELGITTDAVISTLSRGLTDQFSVRWSAVESLRRLQWKQGDDRRFILVALNRLLYDANPYARRSVLAAMRQILRGRAGQ